MPGTLIIGGDGKVGAALAAHLRLAGESVQVTSRRHGTPGALFFDLAGDVEAWVIPPGLSTAVLCAAIPRIDACEIDPQGSARVNVIGMLAIARRLIERGVFTVFCSTNQVFDGQTPHVPPETPQSPCTEYGRQKTQVENELLRLGNQTAIVRFTKIIEPQAALFQNWRDKLVSKLPIEPFVDLHMAPVPLSSAVSALRLICDRRASGMWQVSGERDLNYFEAATQLAEMLGASADLLRPIAARESGRVTTHLPTHTTLCVDRLRGELGLQPPPVEWTVRAALREITCA